MLEIIDFDSLHYSDAFIIHKLREDPHPPFRYACLPIRRSPKTQLPSGVSPYFCLNGSNLLGPCPELAT